MKKWAFTLLAVCTILIQVVAAPRERSVLRISLSNNEPLAVSIDGRKFHKVGKTLTIGDLPRGWHDIVVYEYIEYKKGGGRAQTLYTGRIKVKPGEIMNCMVDVRTQKMMVQVLDKDDIQPVYETPAPDIEITTADGGMSLAQLNGLEQKVQLHEVDIQRLKLLKEELADKKYTTSQLQVMMNWLAFEDSKLDLAKWSYSRVADKENFPALKDVFLLDSSKEEFQLLLDKN